MQGRGERSFGTPLSRGGPAPQSAFLLRRPFPPLVLRLVSRSGVLQHGSWPDFGTALPRNNFPNCEGMRHGENAGRFTFRSVSDLEA
jgi:hypothetical protein